MGWTNLEALLAPIRSGIIPDEAPAIDGGTLELFSKLTALSDAADIAAKKLDADAEQGDRAKARKALAGLEAKKWVTQQAAAVRAEVVRLQKVEEYHQWKRITATTGISRRSGELSEKLITQAYIKRFNEELKHLGAGRIQVELVKTPAAYGKTNTASAFEMLWGKVPGFQRFSAKASAGS